MNAITQKFITINQALRTYDAAEMLPEEERETIDHQISDETREDETADVNKQEESPNGMQQINEEESDGTDTGDMDYQLRRIGLKENRTCHLAHDFF